MITRLMTSCILLLILSGCLGGCDTTTEKRFSQRLESFRLILPDSLRSEFDNGNYAMVAVGIDSILATDDEFDRRWEKIKNDEGIGLFDTAEVVNYFAVHIARQIKKQ